MTQTKSAIVVHIGLHKTATSALQHFFFTEQYGFRQIEGRGPLLRMFVDKASTELLSKSEITKISDFVKSCEDDGLIPVISHERLSGYPLTGGYDRLSIWRRIASLDAECKILLVIREQRKWLYSAWKQMISDGGSISLAEFLQPTYRPTVRSPVPCLEYLNYEREIRTLRHMFGENNVCALPHELIAKDFNEFSGMLFRFAGLEGDTPDLNRLERVNESKSLTHLSGLNLLNGFLFRTTTSPNGLMSVSGRFGKPTYALANKLLKRAPRLPWHKSVEATHQEEINAVVGNYFDDINAATSVLIGMDLRDFGYRCNAP